MISLEEIGSRDSLIFRFPEVHETAKCSIHFQRTLRIPDDETTYPLPPGLGAFPIRYLEDCPSRLPTEWRTRGGVIMPMHQSEAMWVRFQTSGAYWPEYPFAVKIAAGKINAITGDAWTPHLNRHPQDYVVIPEQPWLDGYCVETGVIRQFIAMPLGRGYTAEEQITGAAKHGGLQIIVYPMKAERYEELENAGTGRIMRDAVSAGAGMLAERSTPDMGFAPGGRMKQKIHKDPYGLDAWDQSHSSRCFVNIANSAQWAAITGEPPPTIPPSAADYSNEGLPWFDYYDEDAEAVKGPGVLATVKSVSAKSKEKGEIVLPENEPVKFPSVVTIGRSTIRKIRESIF